MVSTAHTGPGPDPVLVDLASRGYDVTRLDGARTPAAVAAGGDSPNAVTDRPLAVEPLADADPLSVVAPLAANARERRGTVFVATPGVAERAVELLGAPFLLADESPDGRRFHAIPDRIRLADGTLAAVDATGTLTWREDAPGGVTGDDAALVLAADGEAVAALESVDALACPGPDPGAFPYRYERGDDKRFHVHGRDREIGTFAGVSAMRTSGFRPVPLPLVPEHHVRENPALARRWTVAAVADGDVRYETA